MRYAASLTFALTLGLGLTACQLTIGKGDPNTAATPDPNATAAPVATAATPPVTPPTGTAVQAARIRGPGATGGGGAAPGGNLPAPVVTGGNDFGSGVNSPDSLMGQVYFVPEGTSRFPDVSAMKPTAVLYAKQLNIAPRSFEAGFPGVDKRFEWFAVRYTGNFTVATAGAFKFHVLSDDGCLIYVDGAKVLDNDGVHPPQNHVETVQLTAGQHTIQVDYFQGPKFDIALQFWVTPPGGTERLFTTAL
jgi:hypothetical protein